MIADPWPAVGRGLPAASEGWILVSCSADPCLATRAHLRRTRCSRFREGSRPRSFCSASFDVFTGAQFGRWERGECRPRPPLRRVVCELYDASAEALGLLDQGNGAANRRDLLRNAVVLGAAAVSPAWRREQLAGAAVEPAEVASIRDAPMNYDGIWEDEVANLSTCAASTAKCSKHGKPARRRPIGSSACYCPAC